MTAATVQREHMPPVVCAPWCSDGDGHPEEFGRCDQLCRTRELLVEPLVREFRFSLAEIARLDLPAGYRVPDGYGVSARRKPGRLDEVCLRHVGPDTETFLTPAEARQVAAALIATADVIEAVA